MEDSAESECICSSRLQLLERLFLRVLGHLGPLDLFLEIFDFLGLFVDLAQFTVDGPDLFPEKIIPLAFGDLVPHVGLDLGLHGGKLHFPGKQVIDLAQSLDRVRDFQDRLGLADFEAQVRCDQVGQFPRVFDAGQDGADLAGEFTAKGQYAFGILADVAHQGFGFHVHVLDRVFGYPLDPDAVGDPPPGVPDDFCLGHPLHQRLDTAVGQLEHAQDLADRSYGEDVFRFGVFRCRVLLGDQHQVPVPGNGLLHGAHGFFPPHEQRQQHVRENHHVADRHQRQHRGDVRCGVVFLDDMDQVVLVGFGHFAT